MCGVPFHADKVAASSQAGDSSASTAHVWVEHRRALRYLLCLSIAHAMTTTGFCVGCRCEPISESRQSPIHRCRLALRCRLRCTTRVRSLRGCFLPRRRVCPRHTTLASLAGGSRSGCTLQDDDWIFQPSGRLERFRSIPSPAVRVWVSIRPFHHAASIGFVSVAVGRVASTSASASGS